MNPTSPGKADFQIRARFRRAVRTAGIPDGSRLLVAVSGGCDSVSLLRLCLDEAPRRSWTLVVGHVDHSLRPESVREAQWVCHLAGELGLGFALRTTPSQEWADLGGRSPEAPARRIRRRALREMAREAGASWILLGHTLDDQAETVLLNLLRGSGVRGLAGMAPCRRPWLRPLLEVRREALHAYAGRRGLPWLEDPTNLEDRFSRNRLRNKVMPVLAGQMGGSAAEVLARTAETIRPVVRHMDLEARRAWKQVCIECRPNRIRLERADLSQYDRAVVEEVLRRAFRHLRGTARDLKRAPIAQLARSVARGGPASFALPDGIEARLNRREIWFLHPNWDDNGGE